MFPVPSHWREFEDTRVIEMAGCLHARNQKRLPFYSPSDFKVSTVIPSIILCQSLEIPFEFFRLFSLSPSYFSIVRLKLSVHKFRHVHFYRVQRLIASYFEDRVMIPRVVRVSINSLSLSLKKSHLKTLKEYENTNSKNFLRNLRRRGEGGGK